MPYADVDISINLAKKPDESEQGKQYVREFKALTNILEHIGANDEAVALLAKDTAHLVVSSNRIVGANGVDGIKLDAKETETGINVKLRVLENAVIAQPIHLCFGVIPKEGIQEINSEITVEDGASVNIIAHCIFPNAVKVKHIMDATVHIGKNARFTYHETHYHGEHGGVTVIPKACIVVDDGGYLNTTFTLTTGLVGVLDLNYIVEVRKNAVAELTTKVYAKGYDNVKVREETALVGEGARSIIKSRIALRDDATSEIIGVTKGHAPFSRGHVDCTEIVQDRAVAKAIPIVEVDNPLAKVTHEAAIGNVDKKQVETLVARGLSMGEAVDVIIMGMLK